MLRIDGYPIDVELSSTTSFESEATEYPVESGADITDHVRARPIEVEIEGLVSDTPIGAIARDPSRLATAGFTRPSVDAYTRLQQIRDAREPVTIETSLDVYDNMMLIELSAPREASQGTAFKFTAKFRQVTLVTNNRTTVRVAIPGAAGKQNLGHKPMTPKELEADIARRQSLIAFHSGVISGGVKAFDDGLYPARLSNGTLVSSVDHAPSGFEITPAKQLPPGPPTTFNGEVLPWYQR